MRRIWRKCFLILFPWRENEDTDPDARVVFNVGASIDDIWLDNITVQYSELEAPEEEKDDIVVLNENFSNDSTWNFNPWQPSWPSAEIEYTNNQAQAPSRHLIHCFHQETQGNGQDQVLRQGLTLI